MQVSFNPSVRPYSTNFKALSTEQIAEATRGLGQAANFKTDVLCGAIKLDATDIKKLEEILQQLKAKKEVAVSFVLTKLLEAIKPE